MRDDDHISVLLRPVTDLLAPASLDRTRPWVYLDCTAGLGGHAAAIAAQLPPGSSVILSDLDSANLAHAAQRVKREAPPPGITVHTHHGNFAALPRWLAAANLSADLLLADLGFASPQVDDPARGLSFLRDGPLDMRFNTGAGTSAADLIASLPEEDLAQIIYEYGDERHSRAIARAVVAERKSAPITTTAQFAQIVRGALRGKVPPKEATGIDPATKSFQALRIAVNDELGNLHALLDQIEKCAAGHARDRREDAEKLPARWLAPDATIAFITFHSLEDRPVKQSFAKLTAAGQAVDVTRKPVTASDEELSANPRSRSAKLRVITLGGAQT